MVSSKKSERIFLLIFWRLFLFFIFIIFLFYFITVPNLLVFTLSISLNNLNSFFISFFLNKYAIIIHSLSILFLSFYLTFFYWNHHMHFSWCILINTFKGPLKKTRKANEKSFQLCTKAQIKHKINFVIKQIINVYRTRPILKRSKFPKIPG